MTGLLVVAVIAVALGLGLIADRRRQRFYNDYIERREREEWARRIAEMEARKRGH